MNNKIITSGAVFVTVRTKSTRLPGKALLNILGKPTIWHVIQRAKRVHPDLKVIVCTTLCEEDDEICKIAEDCGVNFFRGSEEDKLIRWLGAAKSFNIEFFVTADGDDLLCEPILNKIALEQFESGEADFIQSSAVIPGAFTYGVRVSALEKVCEIKDTSDTEMMWVYFTDSGLFKVEELMGDLSRFQRDKVRITLDFSEDFEFFKTIFNNLYQINKELPLDFVLNYLDDNPNIALINSDLNVSWRSNQIENTKMWIKPEFRHLIKGS